MTGKTGITSWQSAMTKKEFILNLKQKAKELRKEYIHHTGYPGAVRRKTPEKMRAEHPERMIEMAVSGMVPHNRLRKFVLAKLHVYAGEAHPHGSQTLSPLSLK